MNRDTLHAYAMGMLSVGAEPTREDLAAFVANVECDDNGDARELGVLFAVKKTFDCAIARFVEDKPVLKRFFKSFDESKHPRDGSGKFSESGHASGVFEIDPQSAEEWVKTGRAAAFRIQDGRYPLPKQSANSWLGDDEDVMPGVSGYANLSNAIEDMVMGFSESSTGDNYTESAGPDPRIVVMLGREIDGPGAEVVVPDPKIAAVFSRDDLLDAINRRLEEKGFDRLESTSDFDDVDWRDKDNWHPDDTLAVCEILRSQFAESLKSRGVIAKRFVSQNSLDSGRWAKTPGGETRPSKRHGTLYDAKPVKVAKESPRGSVVEPKKPERKKRAAKPKAPATNPQAGSPVLYDASKDRYIVTSPAGEVTEHTYYREAMEHVARLMVPIIA